MQASKPEFFNSDFGLGLSSLGAQLNRNALSGGAGNYNQKAYPVNPIEYLKEHNISSVFRFILTHPDMDHMDGIKAFFDEFSPTNFFDTNNRKELAVSDFENNGKFNAEDWSFYKSLRDRNPSSNPNRLTLYSGDKGAFRTEDWNGEPHGDGMYVLSPTPQLLNDAIASENYNDSSYVILHITNGSKVLFCGDAHDKTWEHILQTYPTSIRDVDLLIAPHHGRSSNSDHSYLDVVNPKLTLFGNASSQHLAYSAWSNRHLTVITNNQANCIVVDFTMAHLPVYVKNENFANSCNANTTYSERFDAWHLYDIKPSLRPGLHSLLSDLQIS